MSAVACGRIWLVLERTEQLDVSRERADARELKEAPRDQGSAPVFACTSANGTTDTASLVPGRAQRAQEQTDVNILSDHPCPPTKGSKSNRPHQCSRTGLAT